MIYIYVCVCVFVCDKIKLMIYIGKEWYNSSASRHIDIVGC